jgi:hypothetical protein
MSNSFESNFGVNKQKMPEVLKAENNEQSTIGLSSSSDVEQKKELTTNIKDLLSKKFKEIIERDPKGLTEGDLAGIHYILNNFFGENNYDLKFGVDQNEKVSILCTIPLNDSTSMIKVISEGFYYHKYLSDHEMERIIKIDDIIYVDNKSKKSLSVKEFAGDHFDIEYNCSDNNQKGFQLSQENINSSGIDKFTVNMPVPGLNNVPESFKINILWHIAKKIEPAILFHQIKHATQKKEQSTLPQTKLEREAWAYSINSIRHLKNEGLDLLHNIDNKEIISRVELDLLSHDLANISNDQDFFSKQSIGTDNKYEKNPLAQKICHTISSFSEKHNIDSIIMNGHSMRMLVVMSAIVKQISTDPTLIKDSIVTKKTEGLSPISLNELLN